MSKKLLIPLSIVIFCVAIFFSINFFLNLGDENKATSKKEMPRESSEKNTSEESINESSTPEEANIIENLLNDENPRNSEESSTEDVNFYINVTPPDCTRECEPYKYDAKEFEYCQNVCGFSPPATTENCEKLSSLEKDYCIKDFAIAEKNFEKCNEIKDTRIKETCQKRIQEEFIEGNF